MPRYISDSIVAICDRCSFKRPWQSLVPDGNSPGLRVCADRSCWDPKNPWRLPPIVPDRISLKWSRPDTPLDAGVPYPDYTNPVNPVPPVPPFMPAFSIELESGTGGIALETGTGFIELESGP